MTRTWTEEQKVAASEAAKARIAERVAKQGEEASAAQEKEILRLKAQLAIAQAQPPRVEAPGDPGAIGELEQIRMAVAGNPQVTTAQVMHSDDDNVTADNSGVAVTHSRHARVRLYKPTGECRTVPSNNLDRLLDQGDGRWKLRCPVCNTDCGGSAWGCGKAEQPKYLRCPVPECNQETGGPKKFFIQIRALKARTDDPNEVHDALFEEQDMTMVEARAKLYSHIAAFHPAYALATGVPMPTA